MDKREAREYIGTNHHFAPEMNPGYTGGTSPKQSWLHKKPAQPILIQRQLSQNSEFSSSPSPSSPSMNSMAFSYPMGDGDKMKKPRIFKSFDFAD